MTNRLNPNIGNPQSFSTHYLLAEYARLLNAHGVKSPEAESFLEKHRANTEFFHLAETAKWLKAALTAKNHNLVHDDSNLTANE